MTKDLFQLALNVTDPWFVKEVNFDVESKRLDVHIDFKAVPGDARQPGGRHGTRER